MSLVVALAGEKEIVIAADTLLMMGDSEGYYKQKQPFPKIFKQNSDSLFVVGITGHSAARYYLTSEKVLDVASFSETVENYKHCIDDNYALNNCHAEFTFAGFEGNEPRIYFCKCYDGLATLEPKDLGRSVSGISGHGAMYFVHRYHNRKMRLEELQILACFAVREAVDFEIRLGRPLELAVVRPAQQPHFLQEKEIADLEKQCERINGQIRKIFMPTMD
ncbi:MAG TPA: hypothetical protein VHA33_28440 [Candidatus Angelobacter sp.]|jgi:20S proteasome alpha/beta subunit|nr:hypothetical protein [Candidatus Angelobacter sp.]